MATQTVPNFKLAKVGEKRERRGGGLPWWPHLATGQKLTVSAVLGCKAGIVGLVAVLFAGAAGTGLMISHEQQAKRSARQRGRALAVRSASGGATQYSTADLKNVRSDRKNQDSLDFFKGSLDGKTPEERAREQAEAEAKAKAEAEAQAKAEAEAQAKAEADVQAKAAIPGMPDMSALTAAANKPSASPSAAMPPSGNKGFGPMAGLSKSMGDASSKASFDAAQLQKPDLSKPVAMKQSGAARFTGGGGGGAGPKAAGRTFSGRQLRYAGNLSQRGAAAGSGESASRLSSQAFEGLHVVQADNVDSGGIGDGAFKAKSDKDPSGTPMDVPGGGGKSSDPPPEPEGESTDPSDTAFWVAAIAMTIAGIAAILLAALSKGSLATEVFGASIMNWLRGIIIVMSAITLIASIWLWTNGRYVAAIAFDAIAVTMLLTAALGDFAGSNQWYAYMGAIIGPLMGAYGLVSGATGGFGQRKEKDDGSWGGLF